VLVVVLGGSETVVVLGVAVAGGVVVVAVVDGVPVPACAVSDTLVPVAAEGVVPAAVPAKAPVSALGDIVSVICGEVSSATETGPCGC
jgi:hypothetical protein